MQKYGSRDVAVAPSRLVGFAFQMRTHNDTARPPAHPAARVGDDAPPQRSSRLPPVKKSVYREGKATYLDNPSEGISRDIDIGRPLKVVIHGCQIAAPVTTPARAAPAAPAAAPVGRRVVSANNRSAGVGEATDTGQPGKEKKSDLNFACTSRSVYFGRRCFTLKQPHDRE
ncbi:hypothetical protein EVAR_98756_1 [Eumeta japonica]|uniref:Uncharacterized protein n=1 Tax=Eumeta variegata TaxID=151549 RepID=A0A4C1YTK3_EUMVA|nr:hypothetical protein EVAR_98756_1 [Eumeta japonica]